MAKKVKITQKYIKDNYRTIIRVGYADLQHMLSCESAQYYTVRAEGWASDVYCFDSLSCAISTGYKTFGNVNADYDLTERYEARAKVINEQFRLDYNARKAALRQLISEFLHEFL